MTSLTSPKFWTEGVSHLEQVLNDGSLRYMLLDHSYAMRVLIRRSKQTFTEFLTSDLQAKQCRVAVNGNYYGFTGSTTSARLGAFFGGGAHEPAETQIQGRAVANGKIIGGDSRPQSFWFGQLMEPTTNAYGWGYDAGSGDPPVTTATISALGGLGPIIVGPRHFGPTNRYSASPPGINEPLSGEPPPEAAPFLIQRSNATFQSVERRSPETGKTILAYCRPKGVLFVGVQKDGDGPGQTYAALASALAQQGFDSAVFLDGSDSATMVVAGSVIVEPGTFKNDTIDVGVGFFKA